jgi:hypothetical protein
MKQATLVTRSAAEKARFAQPLRDYRPTGVITSKAIQ